MLNQTRFTTVSGTTRKIILVDEKNSTAVSCKVANTGINADSNGKKIVKAGTPLVGSLEARSVPFVKNTNPTAASANATVIGTGVTAVEVTVATFSTKVSAVSGTYEFVYDADSAAEVPSPVWKLNGSSVTLAQYGITPTGSAEDGDKIVVAFVAATSGTTPTAILLHDVDVTDGTANAQAIIFGTIDLNKLEADIQTLITSDVKSALKMIQFIR